MKYRVRFYLQGGIFYTEWFDTFAEATDFVDLAHTTTGTVHPEWIEDENNNIS